MTIAAGMLGMMRCGSLSSLDCGSDGSRGIRDVHEAGVPEVLVVPDALQQDGTGQDPASVPGQLDQQADLRRPDCANVGQARCVPLVHSRDAPLL